VKIGRFEISPLSTLLLLIPVSIGLDLMHADPMWIFISSAAAIIPLAGWMGKATEHLASQVGAGWGGFLNASLGNAAELIIGLMALRAGLYDVVKASIAGALIGNVLLVLGLAVLVGGLRHERQTFNRTAASVGATLLALSAIGLVVPAIFHFIVRGNTAAHEQELSTEICVVLSITYLLSLVFALRTHKHLYVGEVATSVGEKHGTVAWSKSRSTVVLLGATAMVALMSEILVSAVEPAAGALGMTDVFVGVILVAIIGNAAEHSTAVLAAAKNQMDLAVNIAIGSSTQVVLFVAPVLVFVSYLFGAPMDLIFTTFEVVSIVLTVGILSLIAMDGESNWMEGVQLLAVYVILAIAFYFLP
jgi:Ca2+:H+ antiporter